MGFAGFLLAAGLAFNLLDGEGVRHTASEIAPDRPTVFFFLSAECPISNSYGTEMARVFSEYSPRGVSFFAVYASSARKHPFPALIDPSLSLAGQTEATVTPEAAVVMDGKTLYRGRIDDRFIDFGKSRRAPRRRDLRIALDEILAGRAVSQPMAKALGCALSKPPAATQNASVTFTEHIAPILHKNCSTCHRSGEAAPFSLLTYEDAAKRAAQLADVTARRIMPPWRPESGYGHFENERGLSTAEIAALAKWAGDGAPEGDPARLPPPPKFPDGWRLGTPELTVEMKAPFTVAADGPDQYMCFVIPLPIQADRWVKAVEFRPGNRKVVHHALMFTDSSAATRGRDSYPCFGAPGFLPGGGLGGWTPGAEPLRMPENTGVALRKGANLVLQIHFHPTGRPEEERARVGFHFADRAPEKRLADIALGSRNIDIPPGERAYKVRDAFTLPVDVDAIGIVPHAHYLCREMKGIAVLPDGKKQWLLWIRDWDFNQQEQYRYAKPVRLPEGTRVEMEFSYDNSDGNPSNPNHPPRRVVWGPDSGDEMAGLHVQVIPVRAADMGELSASLWGKFMRTVGGGFYRQPEPAK